MSVSVQNSGAPGRYACIFIIQWKQSFQNRYSGRPMRLSSGSTIRLPDGGMIWAPDGGLTHVPVRWRDHPRRQTRSLYSRAVLMDEKKPDLAMLIRDILYQESLSSYARKAASLAWT